MSEEMPQALPQIKTSQDVSRIRDIIFGPQIRDYEQRFQTLVRDLERLQQEVDNASEQLGDQDSILDKKIQALRREMRQSNDDLRSELRETAQKLTFDKVDRITMGELFIQLGTNLKTGGSLTELLKNLADIEKPE